MVADEFRRLVTRTVEFTQGTKRNITSINDEASSTTQSSKRLKQGAESLSQVSGELSALVSRFRL